MKVTYIYLSLCIQIFCTSISYAQSDNAQLIDIHDADKVDYTFFNQDVTQQPELQLSPDTHVAGVDTTESRDVDFSFFNNPFALATFYDRVIKAKISGYVQYAAWWSNRQGIGDIDAVEVLFGDRHLFDPDCRDINAPGHANMLVLDTRLRAEFFGPTVLNASTFAFIECDAFGDGLTVNRFRIWHAFLQLAWQNSELRLGQFWHPFSVVYTFPPTVTVDNGSPVTPNSRNPQIRYTIIRGNKKLLLAAAVQNQFVSDGPVGPNSIYLRNARVPILIARAVYDNKERIYAGAGILFQRLKPRLESDTGYHVNESINSAQATLFATIKFKPLEIRQQLTLAQNANNLNLLGGFAVTTVDPITDKRRYTNINAVSYWIDININRKIEPGVFMGIVKNLGARTDIIQCISDPATGIETGTLYSEGKDIDSVFKCLPRIRFHVLPIDFAFELEYTRATYGCIDDRGKVKNLDPVHHIRAMFASYYYF